MVFAANRPAFARQNDEHHLLLSSARWRIAHTGRIATE